MLVLQLKQQLAVVYYLPNIFSTVLVAKPDRVLDYRTLNEIKFVGVDELNRLD